jgi:hypothetical protein
MVVAVTVDIPPGYTIYSTRSNRKAGDDSGAMLEAL